MEYLRLDFNSYFILTWVYLRLIITMHFFYFSASTKTLGNTLPGEKQYMKLVPVIVYFSLVGLLIFYHTIPPN